MTEFLLASDLDPGAILSRVRAAADAVAGAVRGGDGESLIEAIQTPRQKEILARLTALMTLVEGHGDYVMDAVGPQVVPSVAEIRERFNTRRRTAGRVEQAVRRLLGIDLKMRQYADGARFVRAVVDQIGMDGFNKVWESPDTIPTMSEISDPSAWIARVAGSFVAAPPAVTAAVSEPPATAPVNGTSPTSSVGPITEPAPPADVSPAAEAPPADVPPATDEEDRRLGHDGQ
jgi:Zincin-like metallopeptidase